MRALLRLGRDKSALSNMVAYVLLISITVGLSVLVYNWLSFYVSEDDIDECSDGVNIIISSYECYSTSGAEKGSLRVVLKNKGRFTTDGFILRVHDRPGVDFGFYVFDDVGVGLLPGEEHEETYNFEDYDFDGYELKTVSLVEVQPFIMDGESISCKSHTSQDVLCYVKIGP